MLDREMPWSEADSGRFIEMGSVFTPSRDEVQEGFLRLVPASADESFLAVDIAAGDGWLSEAILQRFPRSRVVALDGSPAMLRATSERLGRFEGRFELREFRLQDSSWLEAMSEEVRCFVSSLTIHHLHAEHKQALYRALFNRVCPGGALLIFDLVAPRTDRERAYIAEAWDESVLRQSVALTGAQAGYRDFVESRWNWYRFPDPDDMPSTLPEQLTWLREAGFTGCNIFWLRAGHALYGGYREPAPV